MEFVDEVLVWLKQGPVGKELQQYGGQLEQFYSNSIELAEQFHSLHTEYLELFFVLQLLQIAYEVRNDKKLKLLHWVYQLLIHLLISLAGLLGFGLLEAPFLPRLHSFISLRFPVCFISW